MHITIAPPLSWPFTKALATGPPQQFLLGYCLAYCKFVLCHSTLIMPRKFEGFIVELARLAASLVHCILYRGSLRTSQISHLLIVPFTLAICPSHFFAIVSFITSF